MLVFKAVRSMLTQGSLANNKLFQHFQCLHELYCIDLQPCSPISNTNVMKKCLSLTGCSGEGWYLYMCVLLNRYVAFAQHHKQKSTIWQLDNTSVASHLGLTACHPAVSKASTTCAQIGFANQTLHLCMCGFLHNHEVAAVPLGTPKLGWFRYSGFCFQLQATSNVFWHIQWKQRSICMHICRTPVLFVYVICPSLFWPCFDHPIWQAPVAWQFTP